MENTLQEQIRQVAELRILVATLSQLQKLSYEIYLAAHSFDIEHLAKQKKGLEKAESLLRQTALESYALDGNKAPIAGVIIKEFETLVYDPAVALAWALNHSMALQLDVKAFEKIAKVSPLACVSYRGEARAQIATDLTKLLEEKKEN